ncbi:MAG: NEW3 domain-containing protein [Myxococcales bacterium]
MRGLLTRWVAAMAVIAAVCSCGVSESANSDQSEPGLRELSLEQLTARMLELHQGYLHAPGAALSDELAEVASLRAPLLRQVARTDGARARRSVLPDYVQVSLPDAVQKLVEHRLTRTGKLVARIYDYPERAVTEHVLELSAEERYTLAYAGDAPHALSGSTLAVNGWDLGERLVMVETAENKGKPLGVQPFTDEKFLVLLINFFDNKTTPGSTINSIKSTLFGGGSDDVNTFFKAASQGTATITGDVYGWFTIKQNRINCHPDTLAELGLSAAAQAGIDIAAYDHYVFVHPDMSCGWSGLATVGGDPQTYAWVVEDSTDIDHIFEHELGHNLGLKHAQSADCGSSTLLADLSGCTTSEYGNKVDTMGSGTASYSAFQLEYAGWLNQGSFPAITSVGASGTYTIAPLMGTTAGPRALKVPYGASGTLSRSYYVEYRQPTSIDSPVNNTVFDDGVLFMLATEDSTYESYAFDMHPTGSAYTLQSGETFTDDRGTTFKVVSTSSTGATVSVTLPAAAASCTRAAPTLTITKKATENSYAPGVLATYTIQLTNNDSAGCGASSFALATSGFPQGFSVSSQPSILAYPGTTGRATLRVVPPANASGTTTFTVTAEDASVSGHATSRSAEYTASTCVVKSPTISFSPASKGVASGSSLVSEDFYVEITNNDSADCGTMSLRDAKDLVNNTLWSSFLEVAALNTAIAPGQTVAGRYIVYVPIDQSAGTYDVGQLLTWSHKTPSGTQYTSQVMRPTVVVGGGCTRVRPLVSVTPKSSNIGYGSANNYTVNIRSLDSASCSARSFTLAATPPTGWTATLDSSSVSLSPGGTASATLTVTPSGSALAGDYATVVTVTNDTASSSASATYALRCQIQVNPTVSFIPSKQVGSAGDTLTYTVKVANTSPVACGTETYTLSEWMFGEHGTTGWELALGTDSLAVKAGSYATTTLTMTSPLDAPAWPLYRAAVSATDSQGHSSSATNYYEVPCVRRDPSVSFVPAQTVVQAGSSVVFTATVTSNDTVGCQGDDFAVTPTWPSGWSGPPWDGLFLAGGESGTIDFTLSVPNKVTPGTYTASVLVTTANNTQGSAAHDFSVICDRAPPTITLTPSTQSTVAGDWLDYSISVTNNDAANCPAQDFALTDTVPAGWTGVLDATSLSIAGGGTKSATLTATSSSDAYGAANPLSVTATGSSGTAKANAYYGVTCTRAKPTVTLAPTSQTGAPGATLGYGVTVKNNDSGCSPGVFALGSTLPSGWAGSFTQTSLTLASGASSSTNLSVTSSAGATGTQSLSVSASNADSGSKSASASYVVACTRHAPSVSLNPSTQTAVAGTDLSYSATITNNDSGCSAGTFALASSVPAGYSAILGGASVSLASGASTQVSLSAKSPITASGTASLSVSASNAASGSGSGSADYVATPAPCTRAAPTLSLSPSSQSGSAGAQLSYTGTLKNNDSATCSSGTFTLTSSVPASFTATLDSSSLTVAAGASSSVSFKVTSPANATAGTNSVSVTASNATSGSATGSAGYEVSVPCTRTAPSVVLSPSTQSGAPGAKLTYTVTVTNNDTVECAAQSFTLGASVPPNFSGALSPTSLSLAAGASGSASFAVTAPGMIAPGAKTVGVTASGSKSGSGNGSATFQVTPNQCVRSAPAVSIAPSSQSGESGSALQYTVTITNKDNNVCPSGMFSLSASATLGFQTSLSAGSISLAPNASGSVTLTATSPQKAVAASTLTVSAQGGASGTGSGTATYTPSCVHHAPSLTVDTNSQTGAGGATLKYSVTLTNQDSAVCPAAAFDLVASAPAGFTAQLGLSTVSLAPGAASTIALSVGSPASAKGTNTVHVDAANAVSGNAGVSTDYVVSCVHHAASLTFEASTQSGAAGSPLTYKATLTNNDAAACADNTFSLVAAAPTGFTTEVALPSVSLAPGASSEVAFTVTSPASAYGDNDVSLTASATGSGNTVGHVTYALLCTRAQPTLSFGVPIQSAAPQVPTKYSASLVNRDSGCAPSDFTIAAGTPLGFVQGLSASSVTLGSAASTTVDLTVTAPVAAYGDNALSMTAGSAQSGQVTGSATLSVVCAHQAPLLQVNPGSLHGLAGSALVFTATVSNADVGCPAQDIALSALPIKGFSAVSAPTSLTLASGAGGQATFTVTSSANMSAGSYSVAFTAQDPRGASAQASAVAVVDPPPCVAKAPVVHLSPASLAGHPGDQNSYLASVDNLDSSTCEPAGFRLSVFGDATFTTAVEPNELTLAPGQSSAAFSVKVTAPSDAPLGPSSFSLVATRVQSAGSQNDSGSADLLYDVSSAPCLAGTPTLVVDPVGRSGTGVALTYRVAVTSHARGTECPSESITLAAPTTAESRNQALCGSARARSRNDADGDTHAHAHGQRQRGAARSVGERNVG